MTWLPAAMPSGTVMKYPPQPGKSVRRHSQHLTAADAAELKEIRTACPHLDAAARHVHDFAEMLHHLRGDQLPGWMERVLADDLPALHSLVSGLRRDLDAVTAGLSASWAPAGSRAASPASSVWPTAEPTSTSWANAYSWAHDPATAISHCEIV